jgi:hypothetical protein
LSDIRLIAIGANADLVAWVTLVEPHPAGAFTPMKREEKGPLTAPCPSCTKPLLRDASAEAIAHCSIICPSCRHRCVGTEHLRAIEGLLGVSDPHFQS